MVPFNQRRHRLNPLEIPEVIEGLRLRLKYHLENRENLLAASIAYRAYHRLLNHHTGRPNYPQPITWRHIEGILLVEEMVPIIKEIPP